MSLYADKRLDSTRVLLNQKCFKPFSFIHFNYRGEVGPCNQLQDPVMHVIGDLHRQTFPEVWNGPDYREFRQDLLAAQPKLEGCQWCFAHRISD